jgi:hypothetical protein
MRKLFVAAAASTALLACFSLWPVDTAPMGWEPSVVAPSTAITKGAPLQD